MATRTVQRCSCLVSALMLLSVVACTKSPDEQPTKLISPLYSYESLQTVQRELRIKPDDWQVIEDRRPLSSDKRPPFRMFVISFNHTHLGMPGKLVLTFFNDRLMRTAFYPRSLKAYREALSREDGIAFSVDNDSSIGPATRVWIGKDDSGAEYVGWSDKRLKSEQDDWIRKYS